MKKTDINNLLSFSFSFFCFLFLFLCLVCLLNYSRSENLFLYVLYIFLNGSYDIYKVVTKISDCMEGICDDSKMFSMDFGDTPDLVHHQSA